MYFGQLIDRMTKNSKVTRKDIIYAFASGSHLHGARIEGTSDLDVAGVYIGSPYQELSLGNEDPRRDGHLTQGTSSQYEKNASADVDVKAYTLRRWAALAMKGNPNVLSYLFVPDDLVDAQTDFSVWYTHILPNKHLFMASGHAKAFIGLGESQYLRMIGEKGSGQHGQREDLVEKYGWDLKAGMHMIRSMQECLEFLQTGTMTFPSPHKEALLAIRRGEWSLDGIKQEYARLKEEVMKAEGSSPLPPFCDREAINKVVVDAMVKHWNLKGIK